MLALDDDVIPQVDYIEKILKNFENKKVVGDSGLAVSKSFKRPSQKNSLIKRLFLLDSKIEGSITLGGINVPFSKNIPHEKPQLKSSWLIGCAAWKFSKINKLRYMNFYGQSLFEDVIFSHEMAKHGQLIVDKSIKFEHEESLIGRPNFREFYEMWVFNRYFVVRKLNKNPVRYLAFHWTNLGKLLQISVEVICSREGSVQKMNGFISGYRKLFHLILNK